MERLKTNIIELNKLYKTPCESWLRRFVDGKLDAHEAFKKYGQQYLWLYNNSPYDLIGWEIDNDCFDWEKHSGAVAMLCPEYLDPERYNWDMCSSKVAAHCPDRIDPERFNWARNSSDVAWYCPDKIDPERFDWEGAELFVKAYCPEKLSLKQKQNKL